MNSGISTAELEQAFIGLEFRQLLSDVVFDVIPEPHLNDVDKSDRTALKE